MLTSIAGTLLLLVADHSLDGQGPPVLLDRSNQLGRIRLVASDSFGRELAAASVKVLSYKNIDSGGEFRAHFHERLGTNIPYGRYALVVQQNLSHTNVLKHINLNQPVRVVLVGFNVDRSLEDLGPTTILSLAQ